MSPCSHEGSRKAGRIILTAARGLLAGFGLVELIGAQRAVLPHVEPLAGPVHISADTALLYVTISKIVLCATRKRKPKTADKQQKQNYFQKIELKQSVFYTFIFK